MCRFDRGTVREQLGSAAIPDDAVRSLAFWPPLLPDVEYAILQVTERLFPRYIVVRVTHHGPTPENCDPVYEKLGRRRINVMNSALMLAIRDVDAILERKAEELETVTEASDGYPA